jgi:hypothetical protein
VIERCIHDTVLLGMGDRVPVSARSVDTSLHDRDVVPPSELERGLALHADLAKAVARVQTQRRRVARGDPRDDRVVLEDPRAADQLGENQAAESAPALIARDVDRILGRACEG